MQKNNPQQKNKIFILLPDGIGLRNFAYTTFPKESAAVGFELVFWNTTPFDLSTLGLSELKISQSKSHPLTEIYKNARKQIELNLNIRRTKDRVYDSYRFRSLNKTLNATVKNFAVKWLTLFYSSNRGLKHVRNKVKLHERKTLYFHQCLETLKAEKPALVFCTNQRSISAVAPILAAQELGIPTVCFIYSWDNLPKATMVVESDYYLVWSEHMKNELHEYYPDIAADRIFITGTPQFEMHTDRSIVIPRQQFCTKYNLDPDKKYICYSGDDITTSPNDPLYLRDVAQAVRKLNAAGHNLSIIFRRCPVDFSSRFDSVLEAHNDVIQVINPEWQNIREGWHSILPTPEDTELLINITAHCEMVINLGSSMVFDFVTAGKPCAYMNYDYSVATPYRRNWSVGKTYNFVHFRSMPSKNCVVWMDDGASIAQNIEKVLANSAPTIDSAKIWFKKINHHPIEQASSRIVTAFDKILKNTESR